MCDPLICRTIRSQGFQRLAQVYQAGITSLLGWIPSRITRMHHCLGAMRLVQICLGSREEQLAALLHDVTHRAFSHVVDDLFRRRLKPGESWHELNVLEFVARTDLPDCLGINWQRFFDTDKYKLLEQPAPDLCADRCDYFLRDALAFGIVDSAWVKHFIACLVVQDGRMCLTDLAVAEAAASAFLRLNETVYCHPANVALYRLTADALELALDSALTERDLDTKSDQQVWDIVLLASKTNPVIKGILEIIRAASDFEFLDAPSMDGNNRLLLIPNCKPKVRLIDPLVIVGVEKPRRLSELRSNFATDLKAYRDYWVKAPKHLYFRLRSTA